MSILRLAAKIAVKNSIRSTAVSLVYHASDAGVSLPIDAAGLTAPATETEGLDGQPVRIISSTTRDLIAWPSDFIHDGQTIEPDSGDLLDVTHSNGDVEQFQVSGEPAWRFTDQFNTAYRIHLEKCNG